MSKLSLLKDWRVLLVIIFVVLALVAIAPAPAKGVLVQSVFDDSPLINNIKVGDTIDWINEKDINTAEELYEFDDFRGTLRIMINQELNLVEVDGTGLGLIVNKKPFSNINLGIDLVGGTRVLLQPKEDVSDDVLQQIIATLETRINVYGLREAKFQQINDFSGNVYIQIEMAGGSKEEVEDLLARQGKFQGKIPKNITFVNNIGELSLGDETYDVELSDETVLFEGKIFNENDTSQLQGIDFQVTNITNDSVLFMFTVFSGADIKSVCIQNQPGICTSMILERQNGWEFAFQVFLTQEGADRFALVTKGMKSAFEQNITERYLESKLYLYLDEKEISALAIAADLGGKSLTNPSITGMESTKPDALKEKLKLQSILQSGSLPVGLNIIKIDNISPSLGSEFLKAAIFAAIIAELAVAGVIFIRYRKVKILVPMILWSTAELVLILGAAALFKTWWTIDLAAIAGIIAAIGTGTNDQIMIIDEILIGGGEEGKSIYTMKQRIKRAFFIIFGAAGTIIAAMLPLMFIGIGVMKGFAIATTLGVLIGVIITRPAFGRVAEKVLGGV